MEKYGKLSLNYRHTPVLSEISGMVGSHEVMAGDINGESGTRLIVSVIIWCLSVGFGYCHGGWMTVMLG